MEVILLEKVANLGNLGDKVTVKNGYARNFLVPQGKAKVATKQNIEEFEERRVELEKQSADALTAANGRKTEIESLEPVVIQAKTSSESKLFGSISNVDIVDAAKAAGVDLEKREVMMPNGALRETGEYDIAIILHTDVEAILKVIIESES